MDRATMALLVPYGVNVIPLEAVPGEGGPFLLMFAPLAISHVERVAGRPVVGTYVYVGNCFVRSPAVWVSLS